MDEHARNGGADAAAFEYEAISPELALVDPELARRARDALASVAHRISPPVPSVPAHAQQRGLSPGLSPVRVALALGCAAAAAGWLLSAGREAPAEQPSSASRTALSPASREPPGAAPSQPPLFTWAGVPGAHSYRFTLYRGAARIYEAVTKVPQRKVPLRWTFGGRRFVLTRGTYRWTVLPRLGSHAPFQGAPVVDARYTV